MNIKLLFGFMFCLFSNSIYTQSNDALTLLKKIDQLYRADTSTSTMKMTIVTPDWQRTLAMQSWTKGMDDTFIRILSPRKDRGVTTLKIDKEMWNYFPKINKVIKVPPSMMMGSWMGSDFTNDDLVRDVSLVEEYDVSKAVKGDYTILSLIPREDTVTIWDKIEIEIDSKTLLPVSQSYFNEQDKKIRMMTFSNNRDFNGRVMPSKMTMTPLNKEGHSTIIEYTDANFDIEIDDSTFTLRNLQARF
jgi:outer membrane lipoprotein-sorting protein